MVRIGRLTARPEYLRVAKARRKWVTPGMVVQASRHGGDSDLPGASAGMEKAAHAEKAASERMARFGITVSRKVGNAVQRNRARRRLRAVAREILPQVADAGTDYVLIGRAGTLTRPYAALSQDLRTAVSRLSGQESTGSARRGRQSRDPE